MTAALESNRYTVRVDETRMGWRVRILDPAGSPVQDRACANEHEARLYASAVNQHVYWLSEEQFRTYYRLPEPD